MTQETALPARAAGWDIPAGQVISREADVLALAGRQPPAGGAWLLVTSAEPREGGEFTGSFLPAAAPQAPGGSVLLHAAPASTQQVSVEVWAVVAGKMMRLASWKKTGTRAWPETVRPVVLFAQGALHELLDHGADLAGTELVPVTRAGAALTRFPHLPARNPGPG